MKVYCIENKLDGKKYIGITKGEIDRRFKQHKQITKSKNSSYRNHIHKAMAMYGIENFTVYQVDEANTKEDLFEKEKYWIKKLDTKNNGYNETDGGEGTWGWKPTEEQRKQNSERIKIAMQDVNLRKNLSEKSKQHWENLTEEEKENKRKRFNESKIGNQHAKGKHWKLSDETKKKISESKKGWKMSDETKQKLSDIAKKRIGRKNSPETIERMRQSAILRHQKAKI